MELPLCVVDNLLAGWTPSTTKPVFSKRLALAMPSCPFSTPPPARATTRRSWSSSSGGAAAPTGSRSSSSTSWTAGPHGGLHSGGQWPPAAAPGAGARAPFKPKHHMASGVLLCLHVGQRCDLCSKLVHQSTSKVPQLSTPPRFFLLFQFHNFLLLPDSFSTSHHYTLSSLF